MEALAKRKLKRSVNTFVPDLNIMQKSSKRTFGGRTRGRGMMREGVQRNPPSTSLISVEVMDPKTGCYYLGTVVFEGQDWCLVRMGKQRSGDGEGTSENENENDGANTEEYVERRFVRPCVIVAAEDDDLTGKIQQGSEVEVQMIDDDGLTCWAAAIVVEIWEDVFVHVTIPSLGQRFDRIVQISGLRKKRTSPEHQNTTNTTFSNHSTNNNNNTTIQQEPSVNIEPPKPPSQQQQQQSSSIIHQHIEKFVVIPSGIALEEDFLIQHLAATPGLDKVEIVTGFGDDIQRSICLSGTCEAVTAAEEIALMFIRQGEDINRLAEERKLLEKCLQEQKNRICMEYIFEEGIGGAVVGANGCNLKKAREIQGIYSVIMKDNTVTVLAASEEIGEQAMDEIVVEEQIFSIPHPNLRSVLIGPGGKTIRNIQSQSGVLRLSVDGENVTIFGTRASIRKAINIIAIIIRFDENKRQVQEELSHLYGDLGLTVPPDLQSELSPQQHEVPPSSMAARDDREMVCFACSQKGHRIADCPNRRGHGRDNNNNNSYNNNYNNNSIDVGRNRTTKRYSGNSSTDEDDDDDEDDNRYQRRSRNQSYPKSENSGPTSQYRRKRFLQPNNVEQ